jgi:hypothetical protein
MNRRRILDTGVQARVTGCAHHVGRGLPSPPMRRRLLAEFLGTAFLLMGVIGSGIMAERLSDDVGLQLLENAAATTG